MHSEISFGKEMQTTQKMEPQRITFTEHPTHPTRSIPTQSNPQVNEPTRYSRPVQSEAPLKLRSAKTNSKTQNGEVKSFVVDTNDFKTIKEN